MNRRIVYVVPSLSLNNGIITFIYNFVTSRILNRDEYEFSIITFGTNNNIECINKLRNANINVFIFSNPKRNYLRFNSELDEYFSNNQFDILHLNIVMFSNKFIRYAKLHNPKIKIIMHSHATSFSENKIKAIVGKFFYEKSKKLIDYRIACSKLAGDFLFKNEEYKILYNANTPSLVHKDIRDLLGVVNIKNKRIVGIIGRLDKQKNPLFVKELVECTKEMDVIFVMIGTGTYYEELLSYSKTVKNLILLGQMDDVKSYMNSFDCIIMPSLFEGLPCVAIEAQMEKCPVLLSKNITIESKISNYCYFIDNFEIKEWIKNIFDVKKSEFIKEKSYDFFTESNFIRLLTHIYEEV